MPHRPKSISTRMSFRRGWALLAGLLVVPLVATGVLQGATAADVAPGGDEAMVQYQVRPAAGTTTTDLAGRLMLAGYDVYGGGDGAVFVHAPASAGTALGDRADLVVLAEHTVVLDFDAAGPASQDDILPARLDGGEYPTFYGGYRTVDGHLAFMADLADEYPELVKMYDFGVTWQDADPLRVICVTADADQSCQLDPDVDKPRLLLIAQTHAREITTSELMWRTTTYLVDGYGKKADATSLLDGTEIWIVNNVNPSATKFVEEGITEQGTGSTSPAWQRKTLNDEYSPTDCGTVYANRQEGVDLNRSFDIAWGEVGTSDDPCNQTYGGPEAASESETTGQVDLMNALFRDQRDESQGWDEAAPLNTSGSMINFHSYSNLVMPPWSHWTQRTANDEGLRSLSFRLSHYNGYETGQSSEILYPSSGGTDDWAYQDLGVSGVTYEIGPGSGECAGFFPAYSCQDRFEDENLASILYAGEAARAPYKLSLGPTTLSATARAKDIKIQVKINASDDAYGMFGVDRPDVQNVTAARIYVGKAPWEGGTAQAMTIKGSGSEVTAIVKVTPGSRKKLAYTQAKDADGNWGPIRAVWIPKAA